MWEAIRSNRLKSRLLLALLGSVLVALGFIIGAAATGDPYVGGLGGAFFALVVWLVMLVTALAGGDRILLMSVGARQIQKADMPRLWNVVEEMTIASGMGKMPKVYIIDDSAPNAFAVGRNPDIASVAVTSGLLRRLNRDELQGVVAHEIGHVRNLDVRFMTIAAVTVGTIAILGDGVLRWMWWTGGGRRRRSSGRGGGQGQAILLLLVIVAAIVAPLFAQLLYMACSRRREYLADASAARFTRYPEGLASALEKIALQASGTEKKKVNRAVAPMYIVNPLQARQAVGLFSTHPPTEDRIRILRSMAGGAGFMEYEAAYQKVHGKKKHCLGARTLGSEKDQVAVREPSKEPEPEQEGLEQLREAFDFLDREAGLLVIPCACGVRIKLPEGYDRPTIPCTRCGRVHEVPKATASAPATGTEPPAGPLTHYQRRGKGWESFQCSCGRTLQLSPNFAGKYVRCPECKNKIEIMGTES
ncbi:MAG TPA: hypothetical protein ENN74_03565, partial [Firmicutes bacterium]|nr:hypothetical protein [Bacillota bacterium]